VALLGAVAAVACTALLVLGRLMAPVASAEPAGVLVQYGYRLDVPAGWEHTGGLPERRRVLLTPVAAPEGSDLIAVEHSPLGYDTSAEPQRAHAELRAAYDAAVAAGSALSGYDPGGHVAGRPVTAYRQEEPGGTAVDWFVVLDRDAQLSVGCRHTPAGAEAVRAACAVVVASVRDG
jgi:type VII secretion-associated protein (TIGR03931 family)